MDMPEAGFAGQRQHLTGAGHIRPPGLLGAIGASEGEAGRVVEQFIAVFLHPAAGIGIEAAERLRQVAFENDRPWQAFPEHLLPVGEDGFHAGHGRLLPTAADDDGETPAVEEQITNQVGAQQPGDAGDEQ